LGKLGKSAASFCCQVAAWVPVMLHNFYMLKNGKIAKDLTIADSREKINTDLESLQF
jgi:hypothetical protein